MSKMTLLQAMASGVWHQTPGAESWGRIDKDGRCIGDNGKTYELIGSGMSITFSELFKIVDTKPSCVICGCDESKLRIERGDRLCHECYTDWLDNQ